MAIPPKSVRLAGFFGFLISTAAHALPTPLLGPDGPLWLGPHSPDTAPEQLLGREWILADPESGQLHIERLDLTQDRGSPLDITRRYKDGAWHFSFQRSLQEEARRVRVSGGVRTLEFIKPGPPGEPVLIGSLLESSGSTLQRTQEGWILTLDEERWQFDPQGALVLKTDPRGRQVAFTWADGRLDTISGPGERTLQVRHDANGEITVLEAPGGLSCYYERRDRRLIGARCTDGERSRYVYTTEGALRSILWADSSTVHIRYTAENRVRSFHGPGLNQLSLVWRDNGLDLVEANGANTQVRWKPTGGYDVTGPQGQKVAVHSEDGRIQSWQDPAGGETSLRYDDEGRLIALVTPGLGAWRLRWSPNGLSRVENPLGAIWSFKRNLDGQVIAFTEPNGVETSFRRTTSGQIRSIGTASGSQEIRRDSEGRVISLKDPSGGETKIERNALGEITAFVDPAGQRIAFERSPDGAIVGLTDRNGERWSIDRDTLGRTRGLTTPTGGKIEWTRNSLGRLQRIQADETRWVDYATTLTGEPSRIRSSSGRERGLRWNRGLLKALRLEDQVELRLQHDLQGRLREITSEDTTVRIERNALGQPKKVGPLQFEWLGSRYWTSASAPGLQVSLTRGSDGNVRAVAYGETSIPLSRDSAGRVAWAGNPNERISFQRDASGRIVKWEEGDRTWLIKRDVRGLVNQINTQDLQIRQSFDGEGRLIRQQTQEGETLSAQYDSEGRLSFIRLPTGGLMRFGLGPSNRYLLYEDANGDSVLSRQLSYNAHGELVTSQESDRVRTYHRDLRGRLTAIEESPTAWSWIPGAVEGPNEFLLLLNENRRPISATLPIGTQYWGALATQALYENSAAQVTALSTESGTMRYTLDALGRPTQLTRESGAQWDIQWSPLGHLKQVTDPDGEITTPLIGPGGLWGLERGDTLSEFLHLEDWAWAEVSGTPTAWLRDENGQTRITLSASGTKPMEWSPLGMPNAPFDGPRSLGALSLPWTGLTFDSLGATEALSGQRIQSIWQPYWTLSDTQTYGWHGPEDSTNTWWAPDRWIDDRTLSDPLEIAQKLGILDPQFEKDWVPLNPTAPPLPWLPPSADTPAPPIGPPRGAVPMNLSPLELLGLQAATSPVIPINTTRIGRALLEPEFADLPELRWLSDKGWSWWLMDADQWLGLP